MKKETVILTAANLVKCGDERYCCEYGFGWHVYRKQIAAKEFISFSHNAASAECSLCNKLLIRIR